MGSEMVDFEGGKKWGGVECVGFCGDFGVVGWVGEGG